MKEVVDEILAAEKQVEQTLQTAREEALTIRHESEKEASSIIQAAQEEAQQLIQDAVNKARDEAKNERTETFAKNLADKERLMSENSKKIDMLIEEITVLLTTVDADKDFDR